MSWICDEAIQKYTTFWIAQFSAKKLTILTRLMYNRFRFILVSGLYKLMEGTK
ncbi:MAG: hypothetical protein LBQ01_05895 [Prevotellaceae bacterium]|nr:hypothetical protein [Prevotellaceae bacterium]